MGKLVVAKVYCRCPVA